MTVIKLTEKQRNKVLNDADQKKEMLTDAQLESIAEKLNGWVNVPFIGEEKEKIALVKLVKQVDRFVYSNLPNEIYELVDSRKIGISASDAELIEERLASIINRHINIPYLTERLEQKVFEFILGIIASALIKNKSL